MRQILTNSSVRHMSHVDAPDRDSDYRFIELNEWWPWYRRISRAFHYSLEKDQKATELLSQLLVGRSSRITEFADALNGSNVIVFGAGPSLEPDIEKLTKLDLLSRFKTVAADGATSALLELADRIPDIIVSDLDGPLQDIMAAVNEGSRIIIHAHADNIELLRSSVPSFSKALGSTQVNPTRNVFNFGGFTDGDRAVFMARAMHASSVVLAGMDFGFKIGKYSKLKVQHRDVKLRKLQFGKSLLEWLAQRDGGEYYNITSAGERIAGFRRIDPEELRS